MIYKENKAGCSLRSYDIPGKRVLSSYRKLLFKKFVDLLNEARYIFIQIYSDSLYRYFFIVTLLKWAQNTQLFINISSYILVFKTKVRDAQII